MDPAAGSSSASGATPGEKKPARPVPATRRAHKKSRLGCVQCKQRKIKCDETRPSCQRCIRYSTPCSFQDLQPAGSSDGRPPSDWTPTANQQTEAKGPPSATRNVFAPLLDGELPDTFEMIDMELLHFFTVDTALTIHDGTLVQEIYPKLAFEHPVVMYAMLAISALHLAHARPERREMYLAVGGIRLQRALVLYQKELRSLEPRNLHACVAVAMLLGIYAWASPDKPVGHFLANQVNSPDHHQALELLNIFRGTVHMLRSNADMVRSGPLQALISPWSDSHAEDVDLPPEFEQRFENLRMLWTPPNVHMSPEDMAVLETAHKFLKRSYSLMLFGKTQIDTTHIIMSWPLVLPDEFISMVQTGSPQALVLLGHYCPLLARLDDRWWAQGNATHLLTTIATELDDAWRRWIEWPMAEIALDEGAVLTARRMRHIDPSF